MTILDQKITKRMQENNIPPRHTAVRLSMEKIYNDGVLDGYLDGYKSGKDSNKELIKYQRQLIDLLDNPPNYPPWWRKAWRNYKELKNTTRKIIKRLES